MLFTLISLLLSIPLVVFAADPEAEESGGKNFLHRVKVHQDGSPPRFISTTNTQSNNLSQSLKLFDSEPLSKARKKEHGSHKRSLFEKIFKQKGNSIDIPIIDSNSCSKIHDEVRINIFNADITGQEE